MAFYSSLLTLSLALVCLFSLSMAYECGPEGSGLPACNGTIVAEFDQPGCQGNVTYSANSAESDPVGSCSDFPFAPGAKYIVPDSRCTPGPVTVEVSSPTPSDPYGNCTQPIAMKLTIGSIGTCTSGTSSSSANLCDFNTPIVVPGPVASGPVMLDTDPSRVCYAPGRCQTFFYRTKYADGTCSRSEQAWDLAEDGTEVNVCYDLRRSGVVAPSTANVMYTFDGEFVSMTQYHSGCTATSAIRFAFSYKVDTCFLDTDGTSYMYSVNRALIASSNPTSATTTPPTGAASTIQGSLLISLLTVLAISALA